MLLGTGSYAQQWTGSTSLSGLIKRNGDLSVRNDGMARVSLGHAWGNKIWGRGYIGFNLLKESDGRWSYLNDGVANDGVVLYHSGNSLLFSIAENQGAFSGFLDDNDIGRNVVFKVNGRINTIRVGKSHGNNIQAVSIGPANPGTQMWGGGYIGFNMERDQNGKWLYEGDGGASNGGFAVYADGGGSLNFSPRKWDDVNHSGNGGYITDNDVMAKRCFQIHHSGKVVVGNPAEINIWTPGNYSLYVANGILTERVRVAVKTTQAWADYVFAPDYKLTPLTEVAAFVKANGHLPGVPSAEEVVREGVDAAQMDAKLLEKIEELTLHLIAQEQKIKALEQKVAVASKKKASK